MKLPTIFNIRQSYHPKMLLIKGFKNSAIIIIFVQSLVQVQVLNMIFEYFMTF